MAPDDSIQQTDPQLTESQLTESQQAARPSASAPVISGLQGLRAMAVLAVLGFHWTQTKVPGGFLGVDVFFTLSGFLIGRQLIGELLRSDGLALARFWGRRAVRLLPAATLVAVVAVVLCIGIATQVHDTELSALAALLYVNNWADIVLHLHSEATAHFWSLSVEEQFYVALPLLLLGMAAVARRLHRSLRTFLPPALFGATAAAFAWRTALVLGGSTLSAVSLRTDTRADGLLLGCGVAALLYAKPDLSGWFARHRAPWLVALTVLVAMFLHTANLTRGAVLEAYPMANVCTAVLVLSLLTSGGRLRSRLFENVIVVHLGEISYSLYLWHEPWAAWSGWDHRNPALVLLGLGTVALVSAELSYRFVERPLRDRGRRWLDAQLARRAAAPTAQRQLG